MWIWYVLIAIGLVPVVFSLLMNVVGIILLFLVFGIFFLGYKTHNLIYGGEDNE